jgi:hypothetical protein
MKVNLEYQGKPLFDKKTEKIIKDKYFQMHKHRIASSDKVFNAYSGDFYSGTISSKNIDIFKRTYTREMLNFKNKMNVIGYKIPMPEIEHHKRIARVFLSFSKPVCAVSIGGETWARQQVFLPIVEYDRRISLEKAKSILKKFERS